MKRDSLLILQCLHIHDAQYQPLSEQQESLKTVQLTTNRSIMKYYNITKMSLYNQLNSNWLYQRTNILRNKGP